MGKYISQQTLENALTAQTVAQLFADDADPSVVNVTAVSEVIDRAEGEVDSYLLNAVNLDALKAADRLLVAAATDFAVVFSFERDPAYVRTYGENPRGHTLYKRAHERMMRIQASVQRLPDQEGAVTPSNVGGVVTTPFPKMVVGDAGYGF